jgi:ABC-type dipeptide/oligopeptide/nickel transport system permease subunit
LGEAIGIVIGSVAGYFGNKIETVIMRVMDVWSSLPSMLLCILISTALGSGFLNTALALAIGNVPASVRLIRGQILSERIKEYLEAAESINCSKASIMFRHLLPNVISPMIVHLTMNIGFTITTASALSYIGLGVQPPTPEWGALLSDARIHILNHPHLIMFPGLFIALTVLAINLIGDGLRDALDPKLRS